MQIRILSSILALMTLATMANAANLPGWQRQYASDNVTLISPQTPEGVVQLALSVPEKTDGTPREEFSAALDKAVADLGGDMTLTQRAGVREQGGMLVDVLKIRVAGTVDVDFLLFSYPVGGQFYQSGALAYPSTITDSDPRVTQALDFIATLFNARYRLSNPRTFDQTAPQARSMTVYDNSRTAPKPPAPPAAAPPAQSGQRCERRPIWGFRVSYWCQPSGICNDRVIKGYETVCE